VLRDQSSYSSWYFIERAYIGEFNANVTIALTSSVLGGGGKGEGGGDAPPEHAAGLFRCVCNCTSFESGPVLMRNAPGANYKSTSWKTLRLGDTGLLYLADRNFCSEACTF